MKKIKKKLNLKVMVIVYASFIGVAGQVHGSGSYTTLDLNEQVVMATLWIQPRLNSVHYVISPLTGQNESRPFSWFPCRVQAGCRYCGCR
ncbi:MAG: hypothetical protein QGI64_03245 [Desulfobacterales bacterium]|nr:hypothetical protein [Desulfobacterales bacterium]